MQRASSVEMFHLKDGLYQILAAAVAHSLAIHAGINMAFSTILLPQIMSHNSLNSSVLSATYNNEADFNSTLSEGLVVDKDEATWIASLVTITTPIGSLFSGVLMDRFGRKSTCMMTAVPLILAWCLTALTSNQVYLLYLARVLAGFGAGLSTAGLVYVSETSHAFIRPMLLSLNSAFVSLGILLTTLLGHVFPWRVVAWCFGFLALASMTIVSVIPESPVWLNNISEVNESERNSRMLQSLKWLYRNPEMSETEYRNFLRSRTFSDQLLWQDNAPRNDNAKHPNIWRPVILLLVLFFLQQFSGGYVVIFYAIQIFKAAGELEVDEWTSLIILGVLRFVMAIASALLARNWGRRPLLMLSALGMFASMGTASIALLVPSLSLPILQVGCILAFVFFSSFGFLVIPWTLIGELLPHRFRGKGSGLMISFAYLLMFFTVKMFIYVLDEIGLGYMFMSFAVISIVTVLYVYFYIPETLGKTFEEIEKEFDSSS